MTTAQARRLAYVRGLAVRSQLIDLGVAPQRIRATGFADPRPLQPNDSEAHRAANRRVELVLETVTPAPK